MKHTVMLTKTILAVLSIILYGTDSLFSQSQEIIDSLQNELLNSELSDSTRGEIYQELGSKYIYTTKDSFMHYSRLSLKEFKKANYKKGILRAQVNIGNCHINNNSLDSARYYLSLVENQVDSFDYESLVFLYFNYAFMHHSNTNEYEKAINNYLIAIDYAGKLKDTTKLAVFHYNIADIFGQNGMNEKAFPHNKLALAYAESSNLIALKSIVLYGIGVYYMDAENFDSCMYYFKESLEITDLENDYNGAFYANNGISESYFKMGEYEKSYEFGIAAYRYAQQMEIEYEMALSFCKLSASALMSGRKKEAKLYWNQFKEINDTIQNDYLTETCYRLQSESLAKQNEVENAYKLLQQYIVIKDSIFSKENRSIIAEIETKYETDKKVIEIEKQQLLIEKQKTTRNAILGGSGLICLLGVLVFFTLDQRAKKNKLLFTQKNIIQEQKINQLEKEKKLLAMNAMLEGQEAERIRIAKDLHDGLGGLLSTVKARLSNINNEVKKIESYNIYEKTTSLVDEACDEVRRISHNLIPGALRLDGLKTAVEQLGEELDEAHPFKVKVEVIGFEGKMDETKEVFLYRIIQESTNNIIKYAEAQNVLLQLSETDNEYHLTIEDDGIGFDIKEESEGLGLKSIRSRVDHLQGELDISSNLGQGTTLSVHILK